MGELCWICRRSRRRYDGRRLSVDSEMVVCAPLSVTVLVCMAIVAIACMAVYIVLFIMLVCKYKAAVRAFSKERGRSLTCFLDEHTFPSRAKRVATLLFALRSRSSRIESCRRFGWFLYMAMTPLLTVLGVLVAIGLCLQGVGLVFGISRVLEGVVDGKWNGRVCSLVAAVYSGVGAWMLISSMKGLVRLNRLIRRGKSREKILPRHDHDE